MGLGDKIEKKISPPSATVMSSDKLHRKTTSHATPGETLVSITNFSTDLTRVLRVALPLTINATSIKTSTFSVRVPMLHDHHLQRHRQAQLSKFASNRQIKINQFSTSLRHSPSLTLKLDASAPTQGLRPHVAKATKAVQPNLA
jgi:hypothetical protein